MKSRKAISWSLFLSLCLAVTALAQSERSVERSNRVSVQSLELPPFSIFALPLSDNPDEMQSGLDQSELEAFLAQAKGDRLKSSFAEHHYLWIVPMVFYKSRGLFTKRSWASEELKQGQLISSFLARLADRPELTISRLDQDTFRRGLVRLRDWFVSLCQDNQTLAAMIFTLDSGPFFGSEGDSLRLTEMKLIGSVRIPGQRARFVLVTDGKQPEPMIVGVVNEDESVRWLVRLSGLRQGRLVTAPLRNDIARKVEGYGWTLDLMAERLSRNIRCRIYLDESLNLRFYYLSW